MLSRIPIRRLPKNVKPCTYFSRNNQTLASTAKPHIEMTTLANGLRLVTDSTPGHFSALGAYIDAGSRFEDPKIQVYHIYMIV